MQSKYDLAYFIVYNKDLLMQEADPIIKSWIMGYVDRNNKFKESQYVRDLGEKVTDVLRKLIQKHYKDANVEELLVLFREEEIARIIKIHYIREWLYV